MTQVIFQCIVCDEVIYHEVQMPVSGNGKFYADEVPVTMAVAMEGDRVQCDRCRTIFVSTMPQVAHTVEVTLNQATQ